MSLKSLKEYMVHVETGTALNEMGQQNLDIKQQPGAFSITDPQTHTNITTSNPGVVDAAKKGELQIGKMLETEDDDTDDVELQRNARRDVLKYYKEHEPEAYLTHRDSMEKKGHYFDDEELDEAGRIHRVPTRSSSQPNGTQTRNDPTTHMNTGGKYSGERNEIDDYIRNHPTLSGEMEFDSDEDEDDTAWDKWAGIKRGEEEIDEMFFFPDSRTRGEKSSDANRPSDILNRRPAGGIAKHGAEFKHMKKGGTASMDNWDTGATKFDKQYYGLGGPKGHLPEGKKVDKFVKDVERSEEKAGKSKKEAENIAWATANKRGMLDNKNKKKTNESVDMMPRQPLYESTLDEILMNHPYEHKQCQEGWGMDQALYEALMEHYFREGRIPRAVWHGPEQELRDWVEECYAKDTGMLLDEDTLGQIAGGLGGLALGGPVGAVVGGAIGDKLTDEGIEDRIGAVPSPIDTNPATQNPVTTPAYVRKAQSQGQPLTNPIDEMEENMYESKDKQYKEPRIGSSSLPSHMKKKVKPFSQQEIDAAADIDSRAHKGYDIDDDLRATSKYGNRFNDDEENMDYDLDESGFGDDNDKPYRERRIGSSSLPSHMKKKVKQFSPSEMDFAADVDSRAHKDYDVNDELRATSKHGNRFNDDEENMDYDLDEGRGPVVKFNNPKNKNFSSDPLHYAISLQVANGLNNRFNSETDEFTGDEAKFHSPDAALKARKAYFNKRMKMADELRGQINDPEKFLRMTQNIIAKRGSSRPLSDAGWKDWISQYISKQNGQQSETPPEAQMDEPMYEGKKDYSAKKAAAGKDIGKPGKNFAKIAGKAGKKYGSKEAGERVAGAILKNLRKESKDPQMESWNKQFENVLNEGQSVSISLGNEQAPDTVTVTATDADAHELVKLLQNAGMGGVVGAAQGIAKATDGDNTMMSQNPEGGEQGGEVAVVDFDDAQGDLNGPSGDDKGDEALSFLKKMLGQQVSMTPNKQNDAEGGEYKEPSHKSSDDGEKETVVGEEEMEEGNKFTGNLAKARAAGKKTADLDGDGDEEQVREGEKSNKKPDDDNDGVPNWADKKPGKDDNAEEDSDDEDKKEKVDEADDWAGAGMQDMAAATAQAANNNNATSTEEETAMSEGTHMCAECGTPMEEGVCNECGYMEEGTCNECGMMESDCGCDHNHGHKHEKLDEWANGVNSKNNIGLNNDEEQFQADMNFMMNIISGGLNGKKVDDTTLPHTRVRAEPAGGDEVNFGDLKKLAGLR